MHKSSALKVNDYELYVHLGTNKSERESKQKVILSIEIYFINPPQASITDDVKDTICYHSICNGLEDFNNKAFKTIEALAQKIFVFLTNTFQIDYLKLQVSKFPNIKNLKGSVSFSIDTPCIRIEKER